MKWNLITGGVAYVVMIVSKLYNTNETDELTLFFQGGVWDTGQNCLLKEFSLKINQNNIFLLFKIYFLYQ
jgi:hypothetical protein